MSVRSVVFTEIVCLVFMTGCGCGTEPGTTRAERVDRDRSSLSTNGIEDLMSMLGGPPTRVIGLLDGPGPEVFGTIERVLVHRSGDVFILDRDGLQLTWFGIDGGFRGVFGREGEGPGEFRRVKSLAFGAEGEVVVFDSWLRKLVFLFPGESGLELRSRRIEVPYSVDDFCILNGRLFFHTPGGEKVLQEVTWAGDTLKEFGPSLEFEQGGEDLSHLLHRPIGAALRKSRNEGRLLCMDQPELLVLVAEQMGWARAFTPSGTQVWNVDLPDFHPLHFANPGGTSIAFIPDPESGTIHGLVSLSQIDSLTFSASFREAGLLDQEGALEVRFLSLQTGEQLDLVKGAEFGASGVTDQGVLVGVSNYPFPQVGIFERSPGK